MEAEFDKLCGPDPEVELELIKSFTVVLNPNTETKRGKCTRALHEIWRRFVPEYKVLSVHKLFTEQRQIGRATA